MSYHHPKMCEKNHNSSRHFFHNYVPFELRIFLKKWYFYSDFFISQSIYFKYMLLTITDMMCEGFSTFFFQNYPPLILECMLIIFYINLFIFRRIDFRLLIITQIICENMPNLAPIFSELFPLST